MTSRDVLGKGMACSDLVVKGWELPMVPGSGLQLAGSLCPQSVTLTGFLSAPCRGGKGGQSWLGLSVSLSIGQLDSEKPQQVRLS